MIIVYKKLDDLKPYAGNAKTHPETRLANIALSLERYGWKQPVVIDREGIIICGHGRVQAAQRSNLMRDVLVPCVLADDLTDEQVREFRIVDNKTNESPWDMDALSAELATLDLSAFDFDFGFMDELKDNVVEDGYIPEMPEVPKSQTGDIFQLGGVG